MIRVERANSMNLFKYYQCNPPYTLSGIVVFDDDEPLAVAGVYRHNGYKIAFSDIQPQAKRYRKDIVKIAKEFIADIDYAVYAIVDETEKSSTRFLSYLGFRPVEGKPWLYVREVD